MPDHSPDIESLLREKRVFEPDAEFSRRANWRKKDVRAFRKEGAEHPQRFWARMAKEHVSWFTPWKKVLDWKPPHAKWFVGGKLNVSFNCLDRHLEGENAWRRNKAAIVWEGEPGEVRTLTFGQLHREVCRFANVLKDRGVKKGDRVAIYMPMIPKLAITMLACARIGAPHSVVFGGFSAEALRDRIHDVGAKIVVTADGGFRRGVPHALKPAVDEALEKGDLGVECVVVVRRTGQDTAWLEGRDVWWHDAMANASADCKPAKLDAEHPLFVLYTSGSTGKPKGILHTTGGYLTHVTTTAKAIFDLKEDDTFWCTADCGWVTGHSYVVYGILANGATTLMYEGTPTWPAPDRFWDIVERHRVTVFYTAPTAIRTFIRLGDEHPKKHDLSSLRLLGTVGEPINPEAWIWYHRVIGGKRCPIVDTWWQTETGGILISPLPGADATKPGSATRPFPGVRADVYDQQGEPVKPPDGASSCSRSRGPGCCAASGGTPSATRSSTGAATARVSTSPATARTATRTATSGSWAASTT
jgi:acetyl-CoA synthetase